MYIQANVCIVYSGSDHASYYEKRVKVNVFALASASLHAHIQRGHTIFTRIVAAATINFSLVPVRLLIEGGSYSRAALIRGRLLLLSTSTRIALARVPF